MNQPCSVTYTQSLRSLMQRVGISSFKALSLAAGVSEWQVQQLRQGQAVQMRVDPLYRLSQTLHISLPDLLTTFSDLPVDAPVVDTPVADIPVADIPADQTSQLQAEISTLQQEYQRLQTQLADQRSLLHQEFQQASLHILESLLLQFPTAAYAAQQNPQIPVARLLPLLRPLDQLLQSWGVEAIAPVGTELPYDPQLHQLMEGTAQPGEQVKIRYTGYRQGDKLLYRARVSPVEF